MWATSTTESRVTFFSNVIYSPFEGLTLVGDSFFGTSDHFYLRFFIRTRYETRTWNSLPKNQLHVHGILLLRDHTPKLESRTSRRVLLLLLLNTLPYFRRRRAAAGRAFPIRDAEGHK